MGLCAGTVGANSGSKDIKKGRKKRPAVISEEPGTKKKAGCWEQKRGIVHAICTHHHKEVGKPPQTPLQPTPGLTLTP